MERQSRGIEVHGGTSLASNRIPPFHIPLLSANARDEAGQRNCAIEVHGEPVTIRSYS